MSSFISLVSKFSRPISRSLPPTVFFSSTATIFDDALKASRETVKDKLINLGLTKPLNITCSAFSKTDLQALKVSFESANRCDVLPGGIEVPSFPKKFVLPQIDSKTLKAADFNVDDLKEISDIKVKAFINDIREVIKNLGETEGTDEAATDQLMMTLLTSVFDMHNWPVIIKPHPKSILFIMGEPYVTARPEYVINRKDVSVVVVEDKQLKNTALIPAKGFGEAQLAAEILACGYQNMRKTALQVDVIPDQTIFGVRAISTYFTFYKAVIPAKYWNELDFGLPEKESVIIKRWPDGERPITGQDIADPIGRQEVLEAFAKIRQFLLK